MGRGRGCRDDAWSGPVEDDPRHRLHGALDRAAAYVAARGDPLETLRARALLGEVAGAEVTARLAAEGALQPDAPDRILRSLGMLDDLDQLSGGPGSPVEDVVRGLTARLGADGSFGAEDAPLDERIVRTGMLGGYLTKSLMLRPRIQSAIDAFLCRSWDPDRVKTGAWEPIAAYAHWYSLVDSELSDAALQWCGRELDRGFRTRQFDALQTGRVFVLCHAVALPGASLASGEVCEALCNEQTEDGGFALSARALGGDPVGAALDAMTILVRVGLQGSSA